MNMLPEITRGSDVIVTERMVCAVCFDDDDPIWERFAAVIVNGEPMCADCAKEELGL